MKNPPLNLQDRFRNFFTEKKISLSGSFLIAVSGGIDSIVLCELFKQSGIHFSIAHCNFRLRDSESERDEAFVKSLADNYKVPFHVISFDTAVYAEVNKISIQEAARKLRYDWFYRLKNEFDYSFIVT